MTCRHGSTCRYKSYWKYWQHVNGAEGPPVKRIKVIHDDLCRHFDVVHCMSGGFLNLYLLLSAK